MSDNVYLACRIIATVVGLVMAYYIVPAFKAYIADHVDANINGIITSAVYAAQQTIKDNSDKKQYVMEQVSKWLDSHGIKIEPEQLDMLIESAVLAMKTETR